jgi:hypothetical protein
MRSSRKVSSLNLRNKPRYIRFTVELDKKIIRKLKQIGKLRGESFDEVVRDGLDLFIKKPKAPSATGVKSPCPTQKKP